MSSSAGSSLGVCQTHINLQEGRFDVGDGNTVMTRQPYLLKMVPSVCHTKLQWNVKKNPNIGQITVLINKFSNKCMKTFSVNMFLFFIQLEANEAGLKLFMVMFWQLKALA